LASVLDQIKFQKIIYTPLIDINNLSKIEPFVVIDDKEGEVAKIRYIDDKGGVLT
jgi:hypothetical protein